MNSTQLLKQDLDLDYLAITDLCIALEDAFDIELGMDAEDKLVESTATVQTVLDLVDTALAKK